MKIKAYRLHDNTWLLVDPVGDEGQATVTATDERGIKAQLADVAVITYGWHRPEIVLMSGNPPLNAVRNARRVRVLKAERLVPEYLIGQIVDVVGGRGDDVFVKDPKFPRLDVPILLKKGEYEVANSARSRNAVVQKALNASRVARNGRDALGMLTVGTKVKYGSGKTGEIVKVKKIYSHGFVEPEYTVMGSDGRTFIENEGRLEVVG